VYEFFELYLVKGDPSDLMGRILWLAIPFVFWFPLVVLTTVTICSRIPTAKRFLAATYYVPLCIVLFVSTIFICPWTGGAGLYRLFGWSRGFILGGFLGLVTGAWSGLVVARQVCRAAAKVTKPFGILIHMISGTLMLLTYYFPLALFTDSLGGGSGQNSAFPGVTNWLFWHLIDPWFYYVAGAVKVFAYYQNHVFNGIFWVLVICCLFDIGRRFVGAIQLGSRRKLIGIAATGMLLVATTITLFFRVEEGKARPHIETICSSMTGCEFGLAATGTSKSESYPASTLESERETMSKYFEEWQPSPIKGDPPFRVTSIALDGTTEIELMKSGLKVKSRPGKPFACKEYGQEGLWLLEASYEKQVARFHRYICNDERVRSLVGL
jgi:hypothetical protein